MHGKAGPAEFQHHRIKVLLLLTSLYGGGAERVAMHLHDKLDPSRFDVRMGLLRASGPYLERIDQRRLVVAPNGDEKFNFEGTNRAQYRPATLARALQAPLAFRRMIASVRPDAVMSFTKGASLLTWLGLVGMRDRPAWIPREGNNTLAVAREEAPFPAMERFTLSLVRRAYNRADAVLANSRGLAADLVANFGIDPAKMRMIHNPVDLEAIAAAAEETLHTPPNPPFILTAGRLEYQKGHEVLIRAFADSSLAASHALVILGRGSRLDELRRLADQLGVAEQVRFIGFAANPFAWMARAELFVMPSRWEGFPNAAAEAMSCGAPLLLSDCGFGPRDMVSPRVNGELVAVDDVAALTTAMRQLIDDPNRRVRYAAAGLARVRDFAVGRITERYGNLFTEMAKARESAAPLNLPPGTSPVLERP